MILNVSMEQRGTYTYLLVAIYKGLIGEFPVNIPYFGEKCCNNNTPPFGKYVHVQNTLRSFNPRLTEVLFVT